MILEPWLAKLSFQLISYPKQGFSPWLAKLIFDLTFLGFKNHISPSRWFGVCREKACATNSEASAVSVCWQNARNPIESTSCPLSESDRGLFGFRLAWARANVCGGLLPSGCPRVPPLVNVCGGLLPSGCPRVPPMVDFVCISANACGGHLLAGRGA